VQLLKKVVLVFVVVFIIAQFFRPEKNSGALVSMDYFYAETNPPAEVKRILESSCNDCHSDVTQYPWYNNITPMNYWFAERINDGKQYFNISKWEGNSTKLKDNKFKRLIELIETKEKPPKLYKWTHKDVKLTSEQRALLIEWARFVRLKYSFKPKPE
jgi:hypothetical protein